MLAKILGIIATLGAIASGVLLLEDRYAKAADVDTLRHTMSAQVILSEIRSLEREIFKLELIPENNRSSNDKALLEKLKRDRQVLLNER